MQQAVSPVQYNLLPIFSGVFAAVLVLVPSMSSKFIEVGPLVFVGSTLFFPLTFVFNDILTEVYGYRQSRRVIWTGMAMQIFAAFFYWIVNIWPAPDFWHNQDAYSTILGQAPRVVAASLSAYFCGEFINSYILSRMKFAQNGNRGKAQALRFMTSTIFGEGVDSVIFMTVAFLGKMPGDMLLTTILTLWAVKIAYEVIVLAFHMRIANWVKHVEGIDALDDPRTTNYNPFSIT